MNMHSQSKEAPPAALTEEDMRRIAREVFAEEMRKREMAEYADLALTAGRSWNPEGG